MSIRPVTVEFDIAFVLARDARPGECVAVPMQVVAEVRVTFELVLSRFVNRRVVGAPSFAADSVGFGTRSTEYVERSVWPSIDGNEGARALSGDDLTERIQAFGHLLAHAAEPRQMLKAGEIVTLGGSVNRSMFRAMRTSRFSPTIRSRWPVTRRTLDRAEKSTDAADPSEAI